MNETKKTPRSTETRTNINGVEYIVRSIFKSDARETAEQKILRLIKERVITEINKTEGAVLRSN
jgi:hypothetical protein